MMRVSLIVAMARQSVIGRDGDLPWHLRDDLRRFRKLTTGHVIVMGRRTFDSIGKALPGRVSLVVTRDPGRVPKMEDVRPVISLEEAIEQASGCGLDQEELFVIGGAEIYRLALPLADRLHVTHVEADIDGDAFFPQVDWGEWTCAERQAYPRDEQNDYATRYEVWERHR